MKKKKKKKKKMEDKKMAKKYVSCTWSPKIRTAFSRKPAISIKNGVLTVFSDFREFI